MLLPEDAKHEVSTLPSKHIVFDNPPNKSAVLYCLSVHHLSVEVFMRCDLECSPVWLYPVMESNKVKSMKSMYEYKFEVLYNLCSFYAEYFLPLLSYIAEPVPVLSIPLHL